MDAKTWWIIVAIIVVIAILVLIAVWQGKRRTAARRTEAQQLRTRAKEGEPTLAEARQRAAAAEEAAERARADADAQQERAAKLEAEAKFAQDSAAAVERDRAETLRRADRLDPDTPTDRSGHRIEGTRDSHNGESAIDPVTDKPVEEAARPDDPRAERRRVDGDDDATPEDD